MSLLSLWEKAQPAIKEKIGSAPYTTWFSSIQAIEKDATTLIIETPDEFFKNWILEHYWETVLEKIVEVSCGQDVSLELSVNAKFTHSLQAPPVPTRDAQNSERSSQGSIFLNPRFSFNNFVVGPSNRFSYAACMAVAESPSKAYNPLFIYGAVGLGKTHLMQAVAQQIKINHPELRSCYISSERFTNELIESIRHRSTSQFRQKYRSIDVLLIDDIHFIAGKESTQEEFFHTFNALHNSRKQIIISSDRPPNEIAKLEDRLRSRFAWGLIADIQPPDYETRVAILRKKIEREPVHVQDEVLSFIAEKITTNIRELEGALIRVVAYSLLEEKNISLDMARAVLKDVVTEKAKIISAESILKTTSNYFDISIPDLKSKRRNKNTLLPRQVAMYLCRKLTNLSLPEIGTAFGGKDHTTVLHSCRKIEGAIENDGQLKNTIFKLITEIKQ